MSDLVGNHIVGFPTRWHICFDVAWCSQSARRVNMLIQDKFVPLVFHSMITRGHSCDKVAIPYMIIYINAKK